jgi:hypothetical protein
LLEVEEGHNGPSEPDIEQAISSGAALIVTVIDLEQPFASVAV